MTTKKPTPSDNHLTIITPQLSLEESYDSPPPITNTCLQLAQQLGADIERKLDPKSWFFLLLDNLFTLFFIIIALSLSGGIGDIEFLLANIADFKVIPLFITAMITFTIISSVMHLLTFRFQVIQGEIRVRWGVLNKQKRHLPLHKIHNVGIHQPFFHRLLDVAIVTLESAGSGQESEIVFKVLSHSDALLLEQTLSNYHAIHEDYNHSKENIAYTAVPHSNNGTDDNGINDNTAVQGQPPPLPRHRAHSDVGTTKTLLTLNDSELVKYGLISNAGIAFGSMLTIILSPEKIILWVINTFNIDIPTDSGLDSLGYVNEYFFGGESAFVQGVMWLIITLTTILSIIIAGKVISIISAFLNLYQFTLTDNGKQVSIEKGLITRKKSRVPIDKIQVWLVHESLLHRLFNRQTLKLDTAILANDSSGRGGNLERGISELVPLTTPEQMQALLMHWQQPNVTAYDYYPVHSKAWRRICFPWVVGIFAILLFTCVFFQQYVASCLPFVLFAFIATIFVSKKRAKNMGVVVTDSHIIWRDGWLNRVHCIAEMTHAHGIATINTPFDRRYGMTTLIIDTVGGTLFKARLTMPYLESDIAHTIAQELRRACQ